MIGFVFCWKSYYVHDNSEEIHV